MKVFGKYLCVSICIVLLVSILCSCGKSSEPDNQTETNETTKQTESISKENNDNETASKTLRVYDNGSHTFAIWDYNKDQETMTLIFDESKVIYSYFVFEEMNAQTLAQRSLTSETKLLWSNIRLIRKQRKGTMR